jgi:hypothetical protein
MVPLGGLPTSFRGSLAGGRHWPRHVALPWRGLLFATERTMRTQPSKSRDVSELSPNVALALALIVVLGMIALTGWAIYASTTRPSGTVQATVSKLATAGREGYDERTPKNLRVRPARRSRQ